MRLLALKSLSRNVSVPKFVSGEFSLTLTSACTVARGIGSVVVVVDCWTVVVVVTVVEVHVVVVEASVEVVGGAVVVVVVVGLVLVVVLLVVVLVVLLVVVEVTWMVVDVVVDDEVVVDEVVVDVVVEDEVVVDVVVEDVVVVGTVVVVLVVDVVVGIVVVVVVVTTTVLSSTRKRGWRATVGSSRDAYAAPSLLPLLMATLARPGMGLIACVTSTLEELPLTHDSPPTITDASGTQGDRSFASRRPSSLVSTSTHLSPGPAALVASTPVVSPSTQPESGTG
jgi:hypothetical protein